MSEFERIIGDSMMDESDREWAEMYGEEVDPAGGLDDEWDDGWRWDDNTPGDGDADYPYEGVQPDDWILDDGDF